jgi:Plant transposon protein
MALHAFPDHLPMPVTQCGLCCQILYDIISYRFGEAYNCSADIFAINKLHQGSQGVNGMMGSLECMHTYWKLCPVAWQHSFKGKVSGPMIVLEAIADHYLWFRYTTYGYVGAMNNLNILALSPFIDITNRTFDIVEKEVPFIIGSQQFTSMYLLVDDIYPKYSRFVCDFKDPITTEETILTGW